MSAEVIQLPQILKLPLPAQPAPRRMKPCYFVRDGADEILIPGCMSVAAKYPTTLPDRDVRRLYCTCRRRSKPLPPPPLPPILQLPRPVP